MEQKKGDKYKRKLEVTYLINSIPQSTNDYVFQTFLNEFYQVVKINTLIRQVFLLIIFITIEIII